MGIILNEIEIEIDAGETGSNATGSMSILNEYDLTEFGRQIDVLIHQDLVVIKLSFVVCNSKLMSFSIINNRKTSVSMMHESAS